MGKEGRRGRVGGDEEKPSLFCYHFISFSLSTTVSPIPVAGEWRRGGGGGSGPLFRFCFFFRSSLWTAKVAGVCSKLAVLTTVAQVCSHLIYKKRFLEHVKAKYVLERGLRGKRKEGEEQKLQPAERRGGLGFSFDQMPLTEGRKNRTLAFPDIIHNMSRYPPLALVSYEVLYYKLTRRWIYTICKRKIL